MRKVKLSLPPFETYIIEAHLKPFRYRNMSFLRLQFLIFHTNFNYVHFTGEIYYLQCIRLHLLLVICFYVLEKLQNINAVNYIQIRFSETVINHRDVLYTSLNITIHPVSMIIRLFQKFFLTFNDVCSVYKSNYGL